jgi:hypothetical protein
MKLDLSLDLKIKNEKRKRNQIYILLEYFLSSLTYFDFFSIDAFEIAKKSKYISFYFNQNLVTSDILLVSFFNSKSHLTEVLKESNITETKILKFIKKSFSLSSIFPVFLFDKINQKLKLNSVRDEKMLEIEFSDEVNDIFEKAAENALKRFKTPVITSNILFLTLMEQKKSKAFKILKKLIDDEVEWNLLRYKLIKKIHFHESNLKTEILPNQQYFGYLFKIHLKDLYFDRLIENEILELGISLFRNVLIFSIIKENLFDKITNDIYTSIKITNRRKYSS